MGSDEQDVLRVIDKYSTVFNAMAQEMFARASRESGQTYPNPFNLDRLQSLISGENNIDMGKLMTQQMNYIQKQTVLWQQASKAFIEGGKPTENTAPKGKKDRRFSHKDWDDNPIYNYIKESYLINAEMLTNMIDAVEFSDDKKRQQAEFFTRQYVNSMSPTNYVLTNPEVCEELMATNGQSLVKGMQAYLEDLEQSPLEAFKMRQTDADAFTLGENLANTPGKVVFRNETIELLHYQPTRKTAHKIPMLVTPPFINKYYVMDIEPKKSLVKGLLDAGYQVFMISWVNPDADAANANFFDYMKNGPLTALEVVKEISGQDKVNLTGFCVGGTLSSVLVSYLRAKGDDSVASLTLLTTLLDFSEPGEVGNYFSEEMLPMIEQNAEIKGVFDGRIIAMSFSLLRENSLFWSFFIENYLKGKDPAPFDILYWNSDSTNLPSECFKQYLRMTYWENSLIEPGKVEVDGVPINLANIDVPTYFLTTVADHIVLWKASYEGLKHVSGKKRFVLAGSGHIAGVINPLDGGKYPHWTNDELPDTPEEWQQNAVEQAGSWWKDWHGWLKEHAGKREKPLTPGAHECYPSIEDAPGQYVLKRLE